MNIFKRGYLSLQARTRPYINKYFQYTVYGQKINKLKNIHKGERCFIIGNGPSLTAEDLDKIKNEYSFALNRIYLIFDKTDWRPTFYCSEDEKLLKSITSIIDEYEFDYKFMPIWLKWYHDIDLKNVTYISTTSEKDDSGLPYFSESVERCTGAGGTVTYTAMQIAVYMGFKEIYLLGIDHNYNILKNNKGEIVVDDTVRDYFCDDYNKDKADLYIPNTEKTTLAYIAAKKYADNHNIKICNITRGGKLEIFPRTSLEEVLKL
jgi:hypothetical protein